MFEFRGRVEAKEFRTALQDAERDHRGLHVPLLRPPPRGNQERLGAVKLKSAQLVGGLAQGALHDGADRSAGVARAGIPELPRNLTVLHTSEAKDKRLPLPLVGFCFLAEYAHDFRISKCGKAVCIRSRTTAQYAGATSIPKQRRDRFCAATIVVPEPRKGS